MDFDVVIAGSGMAGSILARVLGRLGLRVALVERGSHPRFALGESSTPLAGFVLERLAARYDLPDLHQLATWGRWTAALPHLRRGLKRGFTFYRHRPGRPFENSEANEARLLVAASPSDAIADTQWLRSDVDQHLWERAGDEGVELLERTELTGLTFRPTGVELEGRRLGPASRPRTLRLRARKVIDATGPAGFLAQALSIPAVKESFEPETSLVFGHLTDLGDFVEIARQAGATMEPGPYPDEKAAVHHLLDEGWLYVLPFDHGVASVGLVLRRGDILDEEPADDVFRRVVGRYPTLAAQFRSARATTALRLRLRLPFRRQRSAGPDWALLPHAFAFADPMFSTGMAWSLYAVERLASRLATPRLVTEGDLSDHGEILGREADQIERLLSAAYLAMSDPSDAGFDRFAATTFLYFGTVSWEESKQRLMEGAEASPGAFLGADDPNLLALFNEALRRLRTPSDAESFRASFRKWVEEQLAPYDVVGLDTPPAPNLFPADLDLLVARAPKLGLTEDEVRAALPRLRGESSP